MNTAIARTSVLIALCLTMIGCTYIAKPPESAAGISNQEAWQAHRNRLAQLHDWSLQGRAASGKALGWTGNLAWRQTGRHFDIRLSAPLGGGGFRATGTLDHVTIRTRGETRITSHPQRMVRRILGWSFPLRPLHYWVRGLPAPGDYRSISVDDQGRLKELHQDGWRVSYLAYSHAGDDWALPKRIVLTNDETRMQLVVARWFDLHKDDNKKTD